MENNTDRTLSCKSNMCQIEKCLVTPGEDKKNRWSISGM